MGLVLISTLFEGYAVKATISKLSPKKIILLIDEPTKESSKKTLNNSLTEIKKFYSGVLEVDTIKIKTYDLQQIMKEVSELIDKEHKAGNEIIIHITEGRKTICLGLLFAAYLKKEKIKSAYYLTEEDHRLIPLPIINFQLGETKRKLLQEVEKGNGVVKRLEDKMKIKPSAIYQHINELKKEGYLENNKELKLTDLGRIMVL